jgi:FAD-dependent oxidoreductase domain-containing protein 1
MKTDVVVIGGGAIGAAVAYYVKSADPGIAVTVVERDPTYELASTPRASGGIRRLFALSENIELSKYSIDFFEKFPDTMAVDGVRAEVGFKKNGYLFIVPPSDRDVLKRNFDTQQRLGCNVHWLEPEELKQKFPSMNVDDLGAAVHSPDDGWLDPHSVLTGFRNKARSLGAQFVAAHLSPAHPPSGEPIRMPNSAIDATRLISHVDMPDLPSSRPLPDR